MHQHKPVAVSIRRETLSHFLRVVRYLLFWVLLFQLCRVTFLIYHAPLTRGLEPITTVKVFGYGFYMDAATACYLVAIPYLLWFWQLFFPRLQLRLLIDCYSVCLASVVTLICTFDLQIYREWGVKLNAQALGYLRHPREAAASMASSPVLLLVGIWILLAAASVVMYRTVTTRTDSASAGNRFGAVAARSVAFLVGAGVIFLCIRGGVGQAPMNPSFAYFSSHPFANHAALNTSWNLIYDVKSASRGRGVTYAFMSEEELGRRIGRIMARGESNETEPILKNDRPNIVCIILESWTADVVQSLGGVPGLTPNLERLIGEGLLFTGIYSSGNRTSYGVPSVLSGYPSLPEGSILEHPQKMEKLPVIALDLRKAGYSSAFYYGGDSRFDNMNSFFLHGGFEKVVDKASFSAGAIDSKWGAHDQALYDRVLADAGRMRQPFLVSMLTLSSHEPYQVPMATVIPGSDETAKFKNAMVYADRCLGDFFRKAKNEPWYGNTLFVLVADHGHRLPLGRGVQVPEKFHIPLLFFGEPLKESYRGTRRAFTGSQADIAATILAQLGLPRESYPWSNNLLNRHRNNYCFYSFKNGFGWRTDDGTVSLDTVAGKVLLDTRVKPGGSDEMLKDGQAYLQYLAKKSAEF
jgi:phosphoglycerol transferase MdoB-like AlkP superfamily enzyme